MKRRSSSRLRRDEEEEDVDSSEGEEDEDEEPRDDGDSDSDSSDSSDDSDSDAGGDGSAALSVLDRLLAFESEVKQTLGAAGKAGKKASKRRRTAPTPTNTTEVETMATPFAPPTALTAGPEVVQSDGSSGLQFTAPEAPLPDSDLLGNKRTLSYARGEPAHKAAQRDWFTIPQQKLTRETKRDLKILMSRNYLDPKRFYKTRAEDRKMPSRFFIGEVVSSAHDRLADRMTKKEKPKSFAHGLMADKKFQRYASNNYKKVTTRKTSGGKSAYRAKFKRLKPKWQQKASQYRK